MNDKCETSGGNPHHLELMDRVYRYQRHIYDLTRKYFLLGRDRLVNDLDAKPGESVVEIGCGTARNLIHIARGYPDVALYGLDASAEMLLTAKEAVRRAGLEGRIVLKRALAEDLSPALFDRAAPFDHAIFSYSLSMIPDWRQALLSAAQSVKAEGHLHVVDFGDLSRLWSWAARALRRWLSFYHVAPRDELVRALENTKRPDSSLRLLPGRYAFVFKGSPGSIQTILNT